MKKLHVLFIVLAVCTLYACKQELIEVDPDIYIMGSQKDTSDNYQWFFWKNFEPMPINTQYPPYGISFVTIDGDDIYGYSCMGDKDAPSDLRKCHVTIWKNWQPIYSVQTTPPEAYTAPLAIRNGNIYFVGMTTDSLPALFVNGKPIPQSMRGLGFPNGLGASCAALGEDVYLHGVIGNINEGYAHCNLHVLWKNGKPVVTHHNFSLGIIASEHYLYSCGLENGDFVIYKNDEKICTTIEGQKEYRGICLDGDDIYLMIAQITPPSTGITRIYKNGLLMNNLPETTFPMYSCIAAANGSVYYVACRKDKCMLMKDGHPIYYLPDGMYIKWMLVKRKFVYK